MHACMHDLIMHLRNEAQARYSNAHDAFDILNLPGSVQLLILTTKCASVAASIW
jgi:hypothetical protein